MAKYIKQEVPDMLKTGQTKAFYRLKTERNISFDKFVEKMCHPGSGLTRGEVVKVLLTASDTLAEILADGCSVSLEDWGTFKATIGLEPDKEMDTIDGTEPKRNARSLRVNDVVFQADKRLVYNVNRQCRLERAGVARVNHSPFTREERLQKALEYISEHGCIRVKHYMELVGLSHTTAACELRDFSENASSGIDSIGRGSALVWKSRSCLTPEGKFH